MKRIFHATARLLPALLAIGFARAQPATGAFGSRERSETALIGILYDLKQDQQRKPKNQDFQELLGRFVRGGWDEGLLNEFYRATRPLYTTQIFIPLMNADHAPRAFEVQDIMQPRQWVIHYKGQVRPPRPGTYRFVGLADDLLAVAVNGKTVLVGEHPGSRLRNPGWRNAPRDQVETPSGPAAAGDWFTVAQGEVVDLDVLIGERPGGQFGAWLMVEEQGASSEKNGSGHSILPVFQLAEAPLPEGRLPRARRARPDEVWFGVQ